MARTPRAQADGETAEPQSDTANLADAVAAMQAVAAGMMQIAQNQEAIRQKKIHEVAHDTAWSADTRKHKFKHWTAFYQNGARVHFDRMSLEDCALVDQLKPGKYNKKKWEVAKTPDGGVSINYSNKSPAQRFDLTRTVNQNRVEGGTGLTAMLQMVITEQEAIAEAKKRRTFVEDDE